ncbi:MAG TPA: O-antigen polymerase [Terracidiphilus sp.]|jgi:oligosaccharide repeat unit polymerase
MKHKTLLLHPLVLFTLVWSGTLSLYLLRLSKLLYATNQEAVAAVAVILVPYALVLGGATLYFHLAPKVRIQRKHLFCRSTEIDELALLKRRLKKWLLLWISLSAVEIVVSRGVPLVWLLTGSTKTYADFGISTLHGLLNSMLLAIGLCFTALFARHGGRRYLLCSLGIIGWAVLVVTRSMIIVNLLQTGMVIMLYRGIPLKLAVKLIAAVLILVVGFGALGDLRSGAENFRAVAQPTETYPQWLPSGVLWVYIYLTTPLNNLIYTMNSVHPANNLLFPNTAAPLFPTIIRKVVYGQSTEMALSGELVDQAFNVSTAYVGPFQDYGSLGMMCFSFLISIAAAFYWWRANFRDELIYVVIAQCLLITVFYDYFFSLPIITQVAWIYLFFSPERKKANRAKYVYSSAVAAHE